MVAMEMELISRETIKPSVPTPPHLSIFPLSFIDHIYLRNYIPLLSFYSPTTNNHQLHHIISNLKKSLSQTLSKYYPLAGTLRDQGSIHCNDQGASFLVTKTKHTLSSFLHNPTHSSLNPLFPDQLQWKPLDPITSTLVAIQINSFACGGIAIGVCMSHKVGDADTLFNFFNDWATINREEQNEGAQLPLPFLGIGESILPQGDLPIYPEMVLGKDDTVCRRFVFEGSKLESLKARVSSQHVRYPSRVEVLMALIFKSAVSALGWSSKSSSLFCAVNLRKRMESSLRAKSVGNMAMVMAVNNPVVENREPELHELVSKIKEGLRGLCDTWVKKLVGKERDTCSISEWLKETTKVVGDSYCGRVVYSSWCRMGMYEADFGWGKPIWVTTSAYPVRNVVFLLDTRDGGGIEALVNMEEEDLAKFERDVKLLQYASLNPPLVPLPSA